MENIIKQKLSEGGINVNTALNRFMGNEALLEKLLKKFLENNEYSKLKDAISSNDQDDAVAAAHTLKGICGNLAMDTLFSLFTKQVESFRADDWDFAVGLMDQIEPEYNNIVNLIQEYIA